MGNLLKLKKKKRKDRENKKCISKFEIIFLFGAQY